MIKQRPQFILIAAIAGALALSACGKNEDHTTTATPPPPAATPAPPPVAPPPAPAPAPVAVGSDADIVVFDPEKITDVATFAQPNQLSTGMDEVLVNGVPVIAGGKATRALPGRVLKGPGVR